MCLFLSSFSISSQKAAARSWNCCYYPWCTAGISISPFAQYDSQVTFLSFSFSNTWWFPGAVAWVSCCVGLSECQLPPLQLLFLPQGRESRKHSVDGTRSGQTWRFWFCLHRGSGQLICGDPLLVGFNITPAPIAKFPIMSNFIITKYKKQAKHKKCCF